MRGIIVFIINFLGWKRDFQDDIAVFNPVTLLVRRFLTQSTGVSRFQTWIEFNEVGYLRRLLNLLHESLQSLSESEWSRSFKRHWRLANSLKCLVVFDMNPMQSGTSRLKSVHIQHAWISICIKVDIVLGFRLFKENALVFLRLLKLSLLQDFGDDTRIQIFPFLS